MLKGLYLTLMIGPVIPVAVPQLVLEALTGAEVQVASDGASGFQLNFTLGYGSPLESLFLLSGNAPIPIIRVILVVTINGTPNVLVDGVMTHHEVSPGAHPGQTTLTVTGKDLSAVMDKIEFTGVPYPAMPPEARVALILAKYAAFGMIPLVIPSLFTDVPVPTERIPRHEGTDLKYIQHLAKEAGYVFYLTPGPKPRTNIAYWGPEVKVGLPQPALLTNMDTQTNVESLKFQNVSDKAAQPVVFIQTPLGIPLPIPIPDINPLAPTDGLIPSLKTKLEFLTGTAKMNPIEALLAGLTASARSSAKAVTGTGSLNVLRYGQPLKARGMVGVRGAGQSYDGLYYVDKVTSRIKRGEFKQDFTLSRAGLGGK